MALRDPHEPRETQLFDGDEPSTLEYFENTMEGFREFADYYGDELDEP